MPTEETTGDCRCREDALAGHSMQRFLDACVERAHGVRVLDRLYHPYHIATDVGMLAILVFSAWFSVGRPGLNFVGFVVAFAATQAIYMLCRHIRHRLTGAATRSFLQDSVLIVLPSFAAASVLVGNDLSDSLDLAALGLAMGLACIRVGCFLGGCCYGRPASWGVLYTPQHLVTLQGCRSFSSGPPPVGRVLPIQLFEAAISILLFSALLAWQTQAPATRGYLLPAYLLGYAVWRFSGDFWRAGSVRPRRAGLSEAQWCSAAVAIFCACVLAL